MNSLFFVFALLSPILTYWNKSMACFCVLFTWKIVTLRKTNSVSSFPIPIKLSLAQEANGLSLFHCYMVL